MLANPLGADVSCQLGNPGRFVSGAAIGLAAMNGKSF